MIPLNSSLVFLNMRHVFAVLCCFVLVSCSAQPPSATIRPTIITLMRLDHHVRFSREAIAVHKICKPAILKSATVFRLPEGLEPGKWAVVIDLIITPTGHPIFKRVRRSSGNPALDTLAVDAAKQTIFRPGTVDGHPVTMPYEMEIDVASVSDVVVPDELRVPPGLRAIL
jgi:TonB family protein